MYRFKNKENLILPKIELPNIPFNEDWLNHLEPYEREWVLSFIKKIKSKNPNWNFNILYNNLPTLTFKKEIYGNIGGSGCYDIEANKISYHTKSSIFHELLHAATSIKNKRRVFCGLEQAKKIVICSSIGKGLNEGYTNFLESIYDICYGSYVMEMDIAKNLNKSVPDMEGYYNNMDLLGLMTYIEQYSTVAEILNFLEMLDYIHKNQFKENSKIKKEIIDLYYECQLYTYGCMISKLLQDIESGVIPKEEAQRQLTSMIYYSVSKINLGRELIEVVMIEKLKNQVPDLANITESDIRRYRLKI